MCNLRSLCITFCLSSMAFVPVYAQGGRSADELTTSSGQYGSYRIDDSTRFMYGTFTVSSNSGLTRISAHRLNVRIGRNSNSSSFRDDLLNGEAFSDGVDIHVNALIWTDILHFSADKISYSNDSLTVRLRGHATLQGDDLNVSSQNITVYLSEWEHLGR